MTLNINKSENKPPDIPKPPKEPKEPRPRQGRTERKGESTMTSTPVSSEEYIKYLERRNHLIGKCFVLAGIAAVSITGIMAIPDDNIKYSILGGAGFLTWLIW